MKTLVIILNHNTPDLVDRLYHQLNPYKFNDYDLHIIENGSNIANRSKYSTYIIEDNVFFGGALNLAIQLTLDSSNYDSLLFLNSDLILHGYNFVKKLRYELFKSNFKILSPSIIQPESNQCYWKPMHNWGSSTTRVVPWIDFQCPMFHIDFLQKINQYDNKLIYGWGNDVYSGIICNDNNWNIGVVDSLSVIHLGSETITRNPLNDFIIQNYNKHAEIGMYDFFNSINMLDSLIEYRNAALNYKFDLNE